MCWDPETSFSQTSSIWSFHELFCSSPDWKWFPEYEILRNIFSCSIEGSIVRVTGILLICPCVISMESTLTLTNFPALEGITSITGVKLFNAYGPEVYENLIVISVDCPARISEGGSILEYPLNDSSANDLVVTGIKTSVNTVIIIKSLVFNQSNWNYEIHKVFVSFTLAV